MKWLIIGAGGQLGTDLVAALSERDEVRSGEDMLVAADRSVLDLSDAQSIRSYLAQHHPDVVINAAAYTAVDDAETNETAAYVANAQGPAWLAMASATSGAKLIHVSTDYVFAGDADEPYREDAATEPRTVYGRTKLAGEQAVLALDERAMVVRTAWVYGATGGNFVKTMLRLAAQQEILGVVADQIGSPTWSLDLARGLIELALSSAEPGVYHCTNAGETSWFDYAQAIFAESGMDPARVTPTTTREFLRPAPRPAYSVLSGEKWAAAGLTPLPGWRESLIRALPAIAGS